MSTQKSTTESNRPGCLHLTVDQGVAWIVLDNPRKYNAMSLAMWRTLLDTLETLGADPAVRCLVLRGEGERAFCAGTDLAEKQGVDGDEARAAIKVPLAALQALSAFGKPTVAMVSGYCLGAGMAIALECDLRIADDTATFGIPAARLGLPYPYGQIKRLTDVVGPASAKQIVFTGDRYSAQQAHQLGLVNEMIPTAELIIVVTATAARIAQNAPLTIAAAKYAIGTVLSDEAVRDIAGCDARAHACLTSEDYCEGRRAFAEKRAPVFRGR